jgi:methylaspartate mutase epsilon subunit
MLLTPEAFEAQRRRLFENSPVACFPLEETVATLQQTSRPAVCDVLSAASRVLVQPRSGVGDHAQMCDLLRTIERDGRPDINTITIDSYTRLNKYDKATQSPQLNGYALVTRGIACGRELVQTVRAPLQVRHGSPDGRLLAEVTYASGITAYEGGGISYNLPYCKDVPLRHSLHCWQYIDRLTALLSATQPLDRETFGSLTGVLTPPSISVAISILEVLLAVEQGVRCVTIGYPQTGALVQDVTALRLIPTLCRQHLQRRGLPQPQLYTSMHMWMGVWPRDEVQAVALIAQSVPTAVMGHATKLITKTFQEAQGIPTAEANASSIRLCQKLIRDDAGKDRCVPAEAFDEECEALTREVDELLDAVYNAPTADLVEAIVWAFERGQLDIPFPASRYAQGAVIPLRDSTGAIRYGAMGSLPFSDKTRAFHARKLEGKHPHDIQNIVRDIYWLAMEWQEEDRVSRLTRRGSPPLTLA